MAPVALRKREQRPSGRWRGVGPLNGLHMSWAWLRGEDLNLRLGSARFELKLSTGQFFFAQSPSGYGAWRQWRCVSASNDEVKLLIKRSGGAFVG